jgi:hypothetical protein
MISPGSTTDGPTPAMVARSGADEGRHPAAARAQIETLAATSPRRRRALNADSLTKKRYLVGGVDIQFWAGSFPDQCSCSPRLIAAMAAR